MRYHAPGESPASLLRDLRSEEGAEIDPEMRSSIRILVVDDDYTLRESCASILQMDGYTVQTCSRGSDAIRELTRSRFDIVLIDLYMVEAGGLEILQTCMESSPNTLAIMMTGQPSVDSSIAALSAGAWEYLPKPFGAVQLQILIGRAAHLALAWRKLHEEDASVPASSSGEEAPLLGSSPAFRAAVELARKVARTDASVFITGESGTGKEMIAQFIHSQSRRSRREMMAVNCAALPETLLESEMFGHCKGAFTGAFKDKRGLLEVADGSTFFLDELTEMSLTIQAKLLRVIQDGVVRRVGSENTDAVVDVRFIAATNRDPQEATEEGLLRKDLFYRLSVVPIRLPPLRERREDIGLLARHFLAHYWRRHRPRNAALPTLSAASIRALEARPWRGNVRELQNVMEHTVVLVDPGSEVRPEDIAFFDEPTLSPTYVPTAWEGTEEQYHPVRERVLKEFERSYLTWLMNRSGTNLSKAAKIAGVDRTTLYRLMEKHGLQRNTTVTSADPV